MARKLSVRKARGGFEVGPRGHGPTAFVRAPDKRTALRKAKDELRGAGTFAAAAAGSFRLYMRKGERDGRTVTVCMDTTR
jgi:hypothetical protein